MKNIFKKFFCNHNYLLKTTYIHYKGLDKFREDIYECEICNKRKRKIKCINNYKIK